MVTGIKSYFQEIKEFFVGLFKIISAFFALLGLGKFGEEDTTV